MGVENFAGDAETSKRKAKRARVLLAAKLRSEGGEIDIRLRDLSCKGALIECKNGPDVGRNVTFVRGATVVPARVAWSAGNRVGLEFLKPIDENEVLIHIARPENRPPERHRRPRIGGVDLTEQERQLVRVWGMNVGINV